ncbi:YvrJ family protein [Lentibacillus sp. JNUCC-1]|nr:YvrJ family protein [Lentibacillus sp. JNUCC-1]
MENWVSFVTEVGFPIAVTFYLLHRIEGKLNVLIESIHAIPDQLKV